MKPLKTMKIALGLTLAVLALGVSTLGLSAQRRGERNAERIYTDARGSSNRSDNDDVNAIIKLQQQLTRGLEEQDDAALDRLAADDFVYVSPQGEILRRSRWLDDVNSGNFNRTLSRVVSAQEDRPLRTEDMDFQSRYQVRRYGDTAIAIGLLTATMKRGTPRYKFEHFSTAVYAKRDNDWQLIYLQLSTRGLKDDRDPFAEAPSGSTYRRRDRPSRRSEDSTSDRPDDSTSDRPDDSTSDNPDSEE